MPIADPGNPSQKSGFCHLSKAICNQSAGNKCNLQILRLIEFEPIYNQFNSNAPQPILLHPALPMITNFPHWVSLLLCMWSIFFGTLC
jgi:hypothetical protein